MKELLLIIVSSALVNNVVLSQFMGLCPFLGVSKTTDTAAGMGGAVIFVITLSSFVTSVIYKLILQPLDLTYLQTIVFILIIAALVQFVEMFLKKSMPSLYKALGVYLPLITTNCAVLGVALTNVQKDYNILEGTVNAAVKGGVIVTYAGVRVFIPASQSGLPRGAEMDSLVKTTQRFTILEVNEHRRRAVGSIKAVLKAEKDAAKEAFWETAEIGKTYKGEVKSLTSYGAFVDLGGIDGMVHISELSWKRIKHPSEVVKVGDFIEVYIKDLDKENNRISLGYKKQEDNPWEKFKANYAVGDVIDATIVSITPFGAFAQIIPGVDGLIHISQISTESVTNINNVLTVGQEVEAKIIDINDEKKKVSLSIRALLEDGEDYED